MIEGMTSEPVVGNKRNIENLINPTKEIKGEETKKKVKRKQECRNKPTCITNHNKCK